MLSRLCRGPRGNPAGFGDLGVLVRALGCVGDLLHLHLFTYSNLKRSRLISEGGVDHLVQTHSAQPEVRFFLHSHDDFKAFLFFFSPANINVGCYHPL